ncbi:MAG: hypothetical protein KC736_02850, partial [Candidatus Moranbacteria bacterium]|nr:hypothetical protein [Candidatus Moranbacteria bacterium]
VFCISSLISLSPGLFAMTLSKRNVFFAGPDYLLRSFVSRVINLEKCGDNFWTHTSSLALFLFFLLFLFNCYI